jgi:hypothetical protein
MKLIKFLIIILVPMAVAVGCHKSGVKPRCNQDHSQSQPENTDKSAITESVVNPQLASPVVREGEGQTGSTTFGINGENGSTGESDNDTDVVGSGDDDRDGGDRRKKR